MTIIEFDTAVEYVLRHEGGYSDDPHDRGGATNHGISLRFLKSLEDPRKYGFYGAAWEEEDVKALTLDQAKAIYKGEFWDHVPYLEKLNNQNLVNYLFDMIVNMGISPSIKCAQRACWAIAKDRHVLMDDGILGEKSVFMMNQCGFYILPVLRAERAAYYRAIVVSNSDQKVFLEGWLNRAYEA